MRDYKGALWRSVALMVLCLTSLGGTAMAGGVELHPVFGVPTPPIDLPYDHSHTMTLLWILLGSGLVALFYAIWDGVRVKSMLPLAIVTSTTLLVITEVFVDVMGCVFYPISHEHTLITILGRQTNYIVLGWLQASAFILLAYKLMEKGLSTKALWLVFIGGALFNFALEETFLNLFTPYVYYGNQPLILLSRFPLWWGFCTFGALFTTGALAYRFRQQMRGWTAFLMLLATPMVFGGFYGFAALPAFIVINGNYSWVVTQAGGLLTILMAFSAVALAIRLLLDRDPFDLRAGRPTTG